MIQEAYIQGVSTRSVDELVVESPPSVTPPNYKDESALWMGTFRAKHDPTPFGFFVVTSMRRAASRVGSMSARVHSQGACGASSFEGS